MFAAALSALCACASSQQEPAQAPDAAPPRTIAETTAMCAAVQDNQHLPVTCETRLVGEVPAMVVGFRNVTEAKDLIVLFARDIGMPFCEAANRLGREARIYMMVGTGDDRLARRWNCDLGVWGPWAAFSASQALEGLDGPPSEGPHASGESQAPERRMDEAIEACNDVQSDENLPFGCRTEEAGGVQSMFVSFRSDPEAKQYFQGVVNRIAAPFCETANREHVEAAVFITVAETRARRFDCKSGEWGEWFEIAKRPRTVPVSFGRTGTPV